MTRRRTCEGAGEGEEWEVGGEVGEADYSRLVLAGVSDVVALLTAQANCNVANFTS